MKKYMTTKKQCQEWIDKLNNVCDSCWRKIEPMETVDNSWNPTYWAWCMHWKKDWGTFTSWVKKDIYELSVKLVLDDDLYLWISRKESWNFDYCFESWVKKTCWIISKIEYMKNNKPRFTKKELEENFIKFR